MLHGTVQHQGVTGQRKAPASSCQPYKKQAARSVRPARGKAAGAPQGRAQRQRLDCRAFVSQPQTTSLVEEPRQGSWAATNKEKLKVSWAGAGVFFFWQLGAMKYLAERYDLTKVSMVGASGGSLASVLAACGVPADRVMQRAYEMSIEHNIWERPLGLLGIWGSLIEKWLDELLPDNAHELCRDRVTVVVTTLPDMKQIGISDFKDKKDLINACMSSSHVPFFLDYKLSRTCRGKQCVDGSFPDFFTGVNCDLLRFPQGGSAIVFDYFDDRMLTRKGRMDMLEVKSIEEIRRMMHLGYEYAAKLNAEGRFSEYCLAEVLLQGENGHISEVLVPEPSTSRGTRGKGLVIELEDTVDHINEQLHDQRTGSPAPQMQAA